MPNVIPDLMSQREIPSGAPAAAISRRAYMWMVRAWRNLEVRNGRLFINGDKVTIEIPQQTNQQDYRFRVYVEGGTVNISTGYLCVIDTDWQEVEGSTLGAVGGGGVVYITRVYPVLDDNGDITTAGYWSAITYGTPPVNGQGRHTIRIATVQADGTVLQEHFGNISVVDLANCT